MSQHIYPLKVFIFFPMWIDNFALFFSPLKHIYTLLLHISKDLLQEFGRRLSMLGVYKNPKCIIIHRCIDEEEKSLKSLERITHKAIIIIPQITLWKDRRFTIIWKDGRFTTENLEVSSILRIFQNIFYSLEYFRIFYFLNYFLVIPLNRFRPLYL